MAISLFPHNQTAYDSLLAMLESEQKVCIVHPTGTGKSFIGFKYCEDHPEESVLWLSPSEYIFKTQCENLTATGATVPGNIRFLTYAKLSIMTEEQLDELKVDTIIEDEFHRTGAPTWGDGLKRLMKRRPNARHIGLSATNIRYLDNQRDMFPPLATPWGAGSIVSTIRARQITRRSSRRSSTRWASSGTSPTRGRRATRWQKRITTSMAT